MFLSRFRNRLRKQDIDEVNNAISLLRADIGVLLETLGHKPDDGKKPSEAQVRAEWFGEDDD